MPRLKTRVSAFIVIFVFAAFADIRLCAVETPLGVVIHAKGDDLTVKFDSSVHLEPRTMVAIFGATTIKKHPLTEEVVVEQLGQIAKGQIKGEGGHQFKVRITWKASGVDIKPGMDVVPLPHEAVPNSPPTQVGVINDVSAPLQTSVALSLPILDPDGDQVSYLWTIEGASGGIGYLEASVTRMPKNTWHAPGIKCDATLRVIATDDLGQKTEFSMRLSTVSLQNDWRSRTLKPFCRFGDNTSASSLCLTRDQQGQWWSVTDEAIFSISPGWFQADQHLASSPGTPLKPTAITSASHLIHLLDTNSPVINAYTHDGVLKRSYGINSAGTDIVISEQGVVFVADQSLGGVQVYEPNGAYRACLGRAGEGSEDFLGLTRITIDRGGQLYALDRSTSIIHRFDRLQRRLTSWTLSLGSGEEAVDSSWHPQGHLLLLLTSGKVIHLDDDGNIVKLFTGSAAELPYFRPVQPPGSVYVDRSGDIFVTYPKDGIITRYTSDGKFYGLRGSPFWELSMFTTDCRGYVYGYSTNAKAIFKLDPEGWIVQKIKASTNKVPSPKSPSKLAVTADGSILVVIDSGNVNLMQFDLTGSRDPIVFGQSGRRPGEFAAPIDAVMDEAGRCYVLDSKLKRVSVFDRSGYFLFNFGRKGKTKELKRPSLLGVTPHGNTAYVYDDYEVKKYTIDHDAKTATHVGNAGGKGRRSGQVVKPVGISCDRQELLYIIDNGRKDLQVVDYRGSNAIVIHSVPFEEWGFQKVTETMLNVDGRLYLIDSGTMAGFMWE